jgi:hypothetical protein
MTVYVDDMYRHAMGQFRRMKMSHMIADTDEELHAMADRIGVVRRWHQGPPNHDSHYDIAVSKRALAIAAGARPISLRDLACMSTVRRFYGGPLLSPAEAVRKLQELRAQAVPTRQMQGFSQ